MAFRDFGEPDFVVGDVFTETVHEYAGISTKYPWGGGFRSPRGNANSLREFPDVYRLPEIRVHGARPFSAPATGPAASAHRMPWWTPTIHPRRHWPVDAVRRVNPRQPYSPSPSEPLPEEEGGERGASKKKAPKRELARSYVTVFHRGRKVSWP